MRPELVVFGWPSHLGGADTRLVHTLPLWAELCSVTVVPNDASRLDEQHWVAWLLAAGAKVATLQELPPRIEGFALALSNHRFFSDRIAHRAKERGLSVVWSSEMMWHHAGELAAVESGLVDVVLYNSELNRGALGPAYRASRANLGEYVVENYVDPSAFPFLERSMRRTFTIGRLSRPDPLKYPDDFPGFYESLGLGAPRYRVMAWGAELATKFSAHRFGPEWELLSANAEPPLVFLESLDAFVYPLGNEFREAWGRSVVEAMLTGLPIVAEPGHHFSRYFEQADVGFLCRDRADFVRACRELEAHPSLRARLGRSASEFARLALCDRGAHLSRWKEVFGRA